jgi:hypothetical protein
VRALPLIVLLVLAVAGCAAGDAGSDAGSDTAAPTSASDPSAADEPSATTGTATTSRSPLFDEALHDELMAMFERDQSGRTGGPDPEGDAARTERLAEILAEHGWPTYDLVGEDGEDAAWTIAQHSDQDPAFQRQALELLRVAVDAGQASPGNLAYLTDRVAVNAGQPQTYGTQVGCGADGARPATPLADEAAVDALRDEAGLGPLADYLAEMDAICAGD